MTVDKSSHVRVKRKEQLTVPEELRSTLGIEEGTLLDVEEEKGTIVLRPAPRLKGRKVVDEKEYTGHP